MIFAVEYSLSGMLFETDLVRIEGSEVVFIHTILSVCSNPHFLTFNPSLTTKKMSLCRIAFPSRKVWRGQDGESVSQI